MTKLEFKKHIYYNSLTLDIVKEWVEGGGNFNTQDENGWTALMCASYNNDLNMVRYLIEKGAKIDQIDNDGWTALIWASYYGYLKIIKILVENGVNQWHGLV
jgi:ankyrin repeat protein